MFEWDQNKAKANLAKHSISFHRAKEVFTDPFALDGLDVKHSTPKEMRFLRIGTDLKGDILTLVYTLRGSENGEKKIRIISIRDSSKKEKKAYKKN